MGKFLVVLTMISLLLLNLLGMRSEAKAQNRSKYIDLGDSYLRKVDAERFASGQERNAYATAALASYVAAIAEK